MEVLRGKKKVFLRFLFSYLLFCIKRIELNLQLLKTPISNAYNIQYFSKSDTLTNNYLDTILRSKPQLKAYLPDEWKISRMSRSFIFTLLKSITPTLYEELKELAKANVKSRKLKKYEVVEVEVKAEFEELLNEIPDLEVK